MIRALTLIRENKIDQYLLELKSSKDSTIANTAEKVRLERAPSLFFKLELKPMNVYIVNKHSNILELKFPH